MTRILAWETGSDWCSVALAEAAAGRQHVVWRAAYLPRRHGEQLLPMARALLADAGWAMASLDALAVGRGPGAFTGVRLGFAAAQGLAFALNRPLVPVSSLAATALRGAWPLAAAASAPTAGEADVPALIWQRSDVDDPPPSSAACGVGVASHPALDVSQGSRSQTSSDADLRRVIVIRDARMGEVYAASYAALEGAAEALGGRPARTTPQAVFVARSAERIETPEAARARLRGDWRDARDHWWSDVAGAALCDTASAAASVGAPETPVEVWPHAREVARLALARPLSEAGVPAWRAEPVYLRDRVAETRAERAVGPRPVGGGASDAGRAAP